ncbi:hypothetical protein [uncultured Arcobacter sp.]|uniref:hypothetical protein n=1 Tax=uncultured Arcobacter sp. TaxID=165434 RepID=UPI0026086412|nr:hypothetical protein [uncultured Arcobacter sp.]
MSNKTPEMDDFQKQFAKILGWSGNDDECRTCNKKVNTQTDFKDKLSLKEYSISGMCQECQDKIFG